MLEKLCLTSMMIVVLPGTLVQVVAGLSIKLCTATLQSMAAPYRKLSDDFFACAVNSAMVAFFIFVLLLKLAVWRDQMLPGRAIPPTAA